MDNSITINDLIVIRNALDLASTRGAFRGAELSTVGGLFDKLQAFLADVEAQASAGSEEAEELENYEELESELAPE